jgi:hypothetical protein
MQAALEGKKKQEEARRQAQQQQLHQDRLSKSNERFACFWLSCFHYTNNGSGSNFRKF